MTVAGPRPGPTNSLVDVAGVRVGHHTAIGEGWLTGTTVVLLGEEGAVTGVDVRGGGPGTRETDLLDPAAAVERAHALVVTGGSAFGLAAADGVMGRLERRGIGVSVEPPAGPDGSAPPAATVPIVPGAVVFDLGRAGELGNRPDAGFGAAAHDAALRADPARAVPAGSVGAGAGAVAGGLRGGVGSASVVLADGSTLGALVVCNAAGSPLDADTGELSGARYGLPGEFDHLRRPSLEDLAAHQAMAGEATTLNTTVAVIATDVTLDTAACTRLAMLGHDGLARAVRPVHTLVDGDTVFAAATGARAQPGFVAIQQLLGAAADTVARATAHALLAATSVSTPVGNWSAYRDRFPSAFDTG